MNKSVGSLLIATGTLLDRTGQILCAMDAYFVLLDILLKEY